MPDVTACDGVRIHYEVEGEGAPVVLLHGMGGSYQTGWRERGWPEALVAHGYRVIGIDARGCGESERVESAAPLRNGPAVGDVGCVLDALGVDRARIVGYSMGAGHALRIALTTPERVICTVLGGLGGIALAMAGLYAGTAAHTREKLVAARAMITGRALATQTPYRVRYAEAYFEALAQDALAPGNLEQIAVPVMLVVGDGDTAQGDFAALTITEMLEQRIPGARRLVLAGVDHGSCVPDPRFREAVFDFFAGHSA